MSVTVQEGFVTEDAISGGIHGYELSVRATSLALLTGFSLWHAHCVRTHLQ